MQPIKLFIPTIGDYSTEFEVITNPLHIEESVVHLYVKYHSVTGLLYFGKTVTQDHVKYLGSGTYWQKHINKHGKEFVKTLKVWSFNHLPDATEFALKFSIDNNIVESKIWANQIPEDALGGGSIKGRKYSAKAVMNMKEKHRSRSLEDKLITSQRMSDAHHNKSPEQKELECKNKSAAIIKVHQNKSPEQRELDSQNMSAGHHNRSREDKEITSQLMCSIKKGGRLYDKVGEKAKYFYEQPEDLSWIPRVSKSK